MMVDGLLVYLWLIYHELAYFELTTEYFTNIDLIGKQPLNGVCLPFCSICRDLKLICWLSDEISSMKKSVAFELLIYLLLSSRLCSYNSTSQTNPPNLTYCTKNLIPPKAGLFYPIGWADQDPTISYHSMSRPRPRHIIPQHEQT